MDNWQNDIVLALEKLGGSASYEELYSEIEKSREELPKTWKAIIRRRVQDLSSDSQGFKNGDDLFFSVEGLGAGVWGLRSSLKETPKSKDLPENENSPERKETKTYRILRDTNLARKLKLLHRDVCQICGEKLELSNKESYSEAHHIKPLGKPHNGPDIAENIIVLCPNHHVLCDYGAIELSKENIRVTSGHEISEEYLKYHNNMIFSGNDI